MYCITLFHNLPDSDAKRVVFDNVQIREKYGVKVLDKGFEKANEVTVRIFTDEDIEAVGGDKIYKGILNEQDFLVQSFTVLKVTDNRKGANVHWRLDCV